MASEPASTVVVSLNGTLALALTDFEGVHRIENRDAVGFYFTVRSLKWDSSSRIAVLFSGTSLMAEPKYFGLPDLGDRDANFTQFAFAAAGDFLDEVGLPPFTPSGVSAAQIEAFSGRFQDWKTRAACSDDEVLNYIKARLYWTWKYKLPRASFTSHDVLRLGIELGDLYRLAELEEGRLWKTHSKSAVDLSLEPTPELLRTARETFELPAPTAPPAVNNQSMPVSAPQPAAKMTPKPKKRGATKTRRKASSGDSTALVFVDEARLTDLRQITSATFDLRKLIAICDELNICYRSQCYIGVAALTRTLLDHVPPIFEVDTFAKLANNYSGGKSFKASMSHLELSARNIADAHLHGQIRKKESLPTRTQVNFAADVDVLLAEVVRVLG